MISLQENRHVQGDCLEFHDLGRLLCRTGGELNWFVWDDEMAEYTKLQFTEIDTLLFGRKTYQMMADYWPVDVYRPGTGAQVETAGRQDVSMRQCPDALHAR
jgi:dihydrofolate reductase